MTHERTTHVNEPSRTRRLFRRFGVAGFAFFFLKGVLWLLAPTLLLALRG